MLGSTLPALCCCFASAYIVLLICIGGSESLKVEGLATNLIKGHANAHDMMPKNNVQVETMYPFWHIRKHIMVPKVVFFWCHSTHFGTFWTIPKCQKWWKSCAKTPVLASYKHLMALVLAHTYDILAVFLAHIICFFGTTFGIYGEFMAPILVH